MKKELNVSGPPWASDELPRILTYVYPENGGVLVIVDR